MKNIFKCFFIFIVIFSFNIVVKAIENESYTSGTAGTTSASCTTGRCIASVGITAGRYSFSDTSIYGVRVTIVGKNGSKVEGPINFWATESMKNAVSGGISLYNTSDIKIIREFNKDNKYDNYILIKDDKY